MAEFHKFLHVERLDSEACEGILNGLCYVSPKIDGTNATIYCDRSTDTFMCGSRKRVLSLDDDNAGFTNWFFSDNEEANRLADLIYDHSNIQVFGEWLGTTKFVGAIKGYDPAALNHLYIFDMYDFDTGKYLHPDRIYELCKKYNLLEWLLPRTVLDHPTMEDIYKAADNNHFLLLDKEQKGEGVVVRNMDYTDKYGHYVIGKFVLDEFKMNKSKPKNKPNLEPGETEKSIVEVFVTEAELTKAMAKTALYFKVDEFDKRQSKMIGYFLNELFNSCIIDEMANILKKYRNPTINFSMLRGLVQQAGRNFLKL